MKPILFQFPTPWGEWPIHSFGLMMVIGFLLAIQLVRRLAQRSKLDPEIFTNIAMIGLIFGVIGARLSHVLENFAVYSSPDRSAWANFRDAINITSGGLTFYGGFLLAFPACVIYGLYKRVPVRMGMDIVAPCLMIGLAFGRIGCFMNGCCHGRECDPSYTLAVTFPANSHAWQHQVEHGQITPLAQQALPVHPAQLYSTFNSLLVAACLLAFFTIAGGTGRVFALMLAMEGASRFLLEMLRAEPRDYLGQQLSFSMAIGILLFIGGIVMGAWTWKRKCQIAPAA